MKRSTMTFTLAALLAASLTAYAGYRFGVRQAAPTADLAAAPVTSKSPSERKPLYWHDPMVPGHKFDKPGRSPFMAMDLVPVYPDDGVGQDSSAQAGVAVSPGLQQNLGLRLAEVSSASFAAPVAVVGNVAFNERAQVQLQARSAGFVEKVLVRAPFDPVRQGQPLVQLTVPDWIAAQEDYLAVKRMPAGAATAGLLDAALQRMRLAGMNEAQVAGVVRGGAVNARTTVVAPASGVVTTISVREGMTVAAGAPLFEINGLATVWVNAEVPESAAAAVRPGALAQVSSAAFPGERFDGKVEALLPQVDLATRTLKARIAVNNPGGKLVPGMFARVDLTPAAAADALSVPSEAVIQTGRRSVVIVALGKGRFDGVEVVTGRQAEGRTEILKGLRAGQQVVASGQFLIDSEASLRGALGRLATPAPSPAPATAPAPASAAPSAATHRTHGTIEKLDKEEITISHDPIPSLNWGPMTMGFKPPAGGLPAGLAAGDKVDVEIAAAPQGGYRIVTIRRAAAGDAHEHGAHQ